MLLAYRKVAVVAVVQKRVVPNSQVIKGKKQVSFGNNPPIDIQRMSQVDRDLLLVRDASLFKLCHQRAKRRCNSLEFDVKQRS